MDEIDAFFARYSGFSYRRDQPIHAEFYRMCDAFGWQRTSVEREEAWQMFRIAVVQAFNSAGSDVENPTSWQRICHSLGITPVPEELREAREAVVETHVNLVDLLQSVRTGSPVEIFPTLEKLKTYTIVNGKYFPKEEAYEGGLLRFLLREILNKYEGTRGMVRGQRNRRPRKNQPYGTV